jgi:hypothetical protein
MEKSRTTFTILTGKGLKEDLVVVDGRAMLEWILKI